jgi:hypothetical protein
MGSTPLITYLSEFIGPALTVLYLALSLITSQLHIPAILSPTSNSALHLVQQASTLLRRSKLELTPLVVIILSSWVCLANDSYRLAQPVYVCYEPIEGINHHHPQEELLLLQWKMYAKAAVITVCVFVWNGVVMATTSAAISARAEALVEGGDRVDEKKVEIEDRRVEREEEGLSGRALLERWRKLSYGRDMLMLCAGVFGVWGLVLLPAKNRELGWWI